MSGADELQMLLTARQLSLQYVQRNAPASSAKQEAVALLVGWILGLQEALEQLEAADG